MNNNEQRDELAREHEHLWLSDLRKHPNGEVRLIPADGKPISGTYAYQVTRSIDAMIRDATRKPRTITTVEELDALPNWSAILDDSGDVAQKLSGWWHFPETSPVGSSKVLKYSATVTVIHEPEAEATR